MFRILSTSTEAVLFEQKHPAFTTVVQGEVCDGAAAAVRPGDQAGVRAGGAGGVQVSSTQLTSLHGIIPAPQHSSGRSNAAADD